MHELLLLVVGAILGAMGGVAVDRIWRRVETKPRFRIQVSHFRSLHQNEDGCTIHVTNAGGHEIPPYSVVIFHPLRGSLGCFPSDDEDQPLLPHQTRQHKNVLRRNGRACDFLSNWLLHEKDQSVEEPRVDDFTLRIVLSKSDRTLFESRTIGKAYATLMLQALGKGQQLTCHWQDLRTPPGFFRRLWEPMRRALGFKSEIERLQDELTKQARQGTSSHG
jgi:hypothetical protein